MYDLLDDSTRRTEEEKNNKQTRFDERNYYKNNITGSVLNTKTSYVSTDYLLGNDKVDSKDYFEEAEAIMFKDIEGFNELSPEKQQEIKDMINRQLKFFIEEEKRDS